LRAALTSWAGSPGAAEAALRAAGIDPSLRGEALDVAAFARLADHRYAAQLAVPKSREPPDAGESP
jgi:hypothetical protein